MSWLWFWVLFWTPAAAYAHCDIPCGIYSPWIALLASRTVWTMVKKIRELPRPTASASAAEQLSYQNSISRMVRVKEDHAELCKRELQILWSDYFKPEHLKTEPKLHELFWNALKTCSKNKQGVDLKAAESLKTQVQKIADLFERIEKGVWAKG